MNKTATLQHVLMAMAFMSFVFLAHTVTAEPGNSASARLDAMFAKAVQLEERRDFTDATRLYHRIYQRASADKQERYAARSAFKLARISEKIAANKEGDDKAGALKDAERNYLRALKHQPEARAIYNNLAELYRRQGKTKQAEEYYQKALAEKIEIKVHVPATERVETIPAQYKTQTENVLVREASERREVMPARYRMSTERVQVRPAGVRWVKGPCANGKADRIDADGTPRCKIEIPAKYKTVKTRVLETPASERRVAIPAEYRTVTKTVKVADEQIRTIKIPAKNSVKVQALEDDGRQTLYKKNLAKLRAEQNNWPEAEPLYRELVLSEPQSSKYHRLLMDTYHENEQNPADYLWQLVNNGQVLRAQDSALAALETGRGSAQDREEWLMIFTAALAKQYLDPVAFTDSERGRRLDKLTADATLADAAKQLLTLLRGGNWQRDSYPFWQQGSRFDEAPKGLWPRDAFRRVTRSMAKWYAANDKVEVAKKCLRMSATFAEDEVDPVAISDLADIYIGLGDIDAVHALLSEYEVKMFEGKGEAYRNSTMEKILEYHSVLGKIYAHAGDNGEPGSITSALFQLENARRVARVLERTRSDKTQDPLFTADLAQLLANEYKESNRNDDAIRLRLDTANSYAKAGNKTAAKRLLSAADGVNWQDYTGRYPDLKQVIETP